MKVYIKYHEPNSVVIKDHTFENIDPTTILIISDLIAFGEKNSTVRHWTFPLSHVVEMRVKEG